MILYMFCIVHIPVVRLFYPLPRFDSGLGLGGCRLHALSRGDNPHHRRMPGPSTRLALISLLAGRSYCSAASTAPGTHDSTAAFVSYVPLTASFRPFSRVGKAVRRAIPGTRANRQEAGGLLVLVKLFSVARWRCLWSRGRKRSHFLK